MLCLCEATMHFPAAKTSMRSQWYKLACEDSRKCLHTSPLSLTNCSAHKVGFTDIQMQVVTMPVNTRLVQKIHRTLPVSHFTKISNFTAAMVPVACTEQQLHTRLIASKDFCCEITPRRQLKHPSQRSQCASSLQVAHRHSRAL